MQALVLVGGFGTRLQPLTTDTPKPILEMVDRPFFGYMIDWLAGHGVDEVVLACHADQSLRLLADPSPAEREILGHLPFRPNEAILHRDESLLPAHRSAWSAWNYTARSALGAGAHDGVAVTYDMEILQRLGARRHLCVTLNDTGSIDPGAVIDRHTFEHPAFDAAAIRAQIRHAEISGVNRTHYCGAYWFNGFHEDGVRSAERVVECISRTHNQTESPRQLVASI